MTYTKARGFYEPTQCARPSGTNTSAADTAPGFSGTINYKCTVPIALKDSTGRIPDTLMYFKATTAAAGERRSDVLYTSNGATCLLGPL